MTNIYRFLFHLHTAHSYDGNISFEALYRVSKKHQITHIAVTEHNNLDSLKPLQTFFATKDYQPVIIPACEYTTPVGDIIILNYDQLIPFTTYTELIQTAKSAGALIVLPHPYKRQGYPTDLLQSLDFFEIFNLRGGPRTFDARPFAGIPHLYGADAHHNVDLPGVLNTYHSDTDFFTTLRTQSPVPQLIRREVTLVNKISKQLSKIKKRFYPNK